MDSAQVSELLFSHLDQTWCQQNIPTLSPMLKKRQISSQEIRTIKEDFEYFFTQYSSTSDEDKSVETIDQLQKVIDELSNIIIKSVEKEEKEEKDFGVSETKKSFMVCNSSIFKKEDQLLSDWDPNCLVGLDVSSTKSFQISPDVRTGIDEADKAMLQLIFKWRGLRSNVQPLSIPLQPKEANEFILGAIIMYSIYNPEHRNFPVLPTDPKSCQELLDKVENWADVGQNIIESFGIKPEIIGSILQKHLTDIVNSSQVEQQKIKVVKKKKPEEQISEIWARQKKQYLRNLESAQNAK